MVHLNAILLNRCHRLLTFILFFSLWTRLNFLKSFCDWFSILTTIFLSCLIEHIKMSAINFSFSFSLLYTLKFMDLSRNFTALIAQHVFDLLAFCTLTFIEAIFNRLNRFQLLWYLQLSLINSQTSAQGVFLLCGKWEKGIFICVDFIHTLCLYSLIFTHFKPLSPEKDECHKSFTPIRLNKIFAWAIFTRKYLRFAAREALVDYQSARYKFFTGKICLCIRKGKIRSFRFAHSYLCTCVPMQMSKKNLAANCSHGENLKRWRCWASAIVRKMRKRRGILETRIKIVNLVCYTVMNISTKYWPPQLHCNFLLNHVRVPLCNGK